MKKLIALIALFMFAAVMSYAAETLAATGQARAKIVAAAAITHDSSAALDFGTLVKPTAAATVTLTAANPTVVTDSSGLVRASGNTTADHFSLSNLDNGTTYTLQIPATTTITNGSATMTVHLDPSQSSFTGTAAGTDDLYVGGVLDIGANQDPGSYTGSYSVSLTY